MNKPELGGHYIGLRENLQERPIFQGKKLSCELSLKPIHGRGPHQTKQMWLVLWTSFPGTISRHLTAIFLDEHRGRFSRHREGITISINDNQQYLENHLTRVYSLHVASRDFERWTQQPSSWSQTFSSPRHRYGIKEKMLQARLEAQFQNFKWSLVSQRLILCEQEFGINSEPRRLLHQSDPASSVHTLQQNSMPYGIKADTPCSGSFWSLHEPSPDLQK